MDAVAPDDLASLREVWTGGADCPEAIRSAFAEKFGLPVLATYGLTEAPTVVAIDPVGGPHVEGASGRPLPHLEVTVRDGEVCVGPAPGDDRYRLMLGYWQRPEATAEALAGGVLHTGDIGELDADGFLHVRDRKSLVIIRGGANVYPAEVERVLGEAPGVEACAVLGIPDERLGERVVAVVEGAVDVDEVLAHCRVQLAKYKVPERIAVVDALPRNAMGKVVRAELPALVSRHAPPPAPTG
jgi:acyl-CoA synthetase (AMP-forming)/AMP-acid ligase II